MTEFSIGLANHIKGIIIISCILCSKTLLLLLLCMLIYLASLKL